MTRKISSRDHKKIAEYIVDEFNRRETARADRDKQWKEIDRQLAMQPNKLVKASLGKEGTWFPEIELPLQSNALEILGADIARLIFPPGEDWYEAEALMTPEWEEAFREHDTTGVVGGNPDQDTANVIVHGVLDHFHRQYNFRKQWKYMLNEAVAYGTFAGRAGIVKPYTISDDFRRTSNTKQPVLIPVSIKDLFLDDSENRVLQEGIRISPSFIRRSWKRLKDLKLQTGEGWMNLSKVEATSHKSPGHVKVLEFEGDLVLDRSKGEDMFIPNVQVTVAVSGTPTIIRWKKLDLPFRSYITGMYNPDGIDCPYGTSPLMKGRPIQEAASLATNFTLAISALQAWPPVIYDAEDRELIANPPNIAPNQKIRSDNPNGIKTLEIGDLVSTYNVLAGLRQQYEETTKVNDPRRGATTNSHTTAFAKDVELSRGLLPTEDMVEDVETGPLTTWMYMEHVLARKALQTEQTVFLNARGVKGHIRINSSIFPEQADYIAKGSKGVLSKREREQSFAEFGTMVANLTPLLLQAPPDVSTSLGNILIELARIKGITDAERFVPKPQAQAGPADAGPGVSGPAEVLQGPGSAEIPVG